MSDSAFEKKPGVLYQNADLPAAQTSGRKEAAVLIPLIRQQQQWEILFIRRSDNEHDHHSGQVAFPGGARESDDDSLVTTALRETSEEIGITDERIQVIDVLHPYLTVSNFRVTPVVGVVDWPTALTLAPREVARVFSIPLDWLRNRDNVDVRERKVEHPTERRHPVIYFKKYEGEILWGASARMTLNFIKAFEEKTIVLPKHN